MNIDEYNERSKHKQSQMFIHCVWVPRCVFTLSQISLEFYFVRRVADGKLFSHKNETKFTAAEFWLCDSNRNETFLKLNSFWFCSDQQPVHHRTARPGVN